MTRSEAGARLCPIVPIECPYVRRECPEELAGRWHLGNEWIVLARCLRTTFGTQELAWHECTGCVILSYSPDLLIVSGDWTQACFRAHEVCWGVFTGVFTVYSFKWHRVELWSIIPKKTTVETWNVSGIRSTEALGKAKESWGKNIWTAYCCKLTVAYCCLVAVWLHPPALLPRP